MKEESNKEKKVTIIETTLPNGKSSLNVETTLPASELIGILEITLFRTKTWLTKQWGS